MKRRIIQRGDVYIADLGTGIGSEQEGTRPVLVIQNDVGNRYSPTVIVAPITTRPKTNIPTHAFLPDNHFLRPASCIMLEQIRTIDQQRLGNYLDTLSKRQMKQVNYAISISVGLHHNYQ